MACKNMVFGKKEAVYNIACSKILCTWWINPVFLFLGWQVTFITYPQLCKGIEGIMGL